MARFLWLPVALVAAGSIFAKIGNAEAVDECRKNLSSCDLQEGSTFLRSQIWTMGDCTSRQWSKLPAVGFPFDEGRLQTGRRAPLAFLGGACEFHAPSGNVDEGISQLQSAQTAGLLPSQRNAASLFEGLLHCRKLDNLKARYGEDVRSKLAPRETFCATRAMAKASFARVSWTNFQMSYEADAPFSLSQHIESMTQCYQNHLHGGYDATCGIVSTPSDAQVQGAAKRAADGVLAAYFGAAATDTPDAPGGVPPLTAMLSRKLEMTNKALTDAQALLDGLKAKRDLLSTSLTSVGTPYCNVTSLADSSIPCTGDIPNAVGRMHAQYQSAVLGAQDLLGFTTQWLNGFYSENGTNILTSLDANLKLLGPKLAAISDGGTEPSLQGKLDRIKSDMTAWATGDGNARALVQRACSVYFCEMRRRQPSQFQSTCAMNDGSGTVASNNKLCDANPRATFVTTDVSPNGPTAVTLCRAAGFPETYMFPPPPPPPPRTVDPEVDACMATYHP